MVTRKSQRVTFFMPEKQYFCTGFPKTTTSACHNFNPREMSRTNNKQNYGKEN